MKITCTELATATATVQLWRVYADQAQAFTTAADRVTIDNVSGGANNWHVSPLDVFMDAAKLFQDLRGNT